MTNLDQNMQTILETLKQKAANTSSIAELERLVLKASQDFAHCLRNARQDPACEDAVSVSALAGATAFSGASGSLAVDMHNRV